jgi:hypothetical protein
MKDQLFEMLLSLFEQALTNLRVNQLQTELSAQDQQTKSLDDTEYGDLKIYKSPSKSACRVLTLLEQVKLTKPAIQFIMRLRHTEVLDSEMFERVMNMVLESPQRFVSVGELMAILHVVMVEHLSDREMMMLEFAINLENSHTTMH